MCNVVYVYVLFVYILCTACVYLVYILCISCVYLVDYGYNGALVNPLVNPLHPICVSIQSYSAASYGGAQTLC